MGNPIPVALMLLPIGESTFQAEICVRMLLDLSALIDSGDEHEDRLISAIRVLVDVKTGEVVNLLVSKFKWNREHMRCAEKKRHELIVSTTAHLVAVMRADMPTETRSLVVLTHLFGMSQRAFITIHAQVTEVFAERNTVEIKKLPPPDNIA